VVGGRGFAKLRLGWGERSVSKVGEREKTERLLGERSMRWVFILIFNFFKEQKVTTPQFVNYGHVGKS
jgi:hypothetical protein